MLYLKSIPDVKKADVALQDAMMAFQSAIAKDPNHAESHALMGTLYGMKIQGSVLRAVRYGPRLQKHQKQALAFGANNPRVLYLYGTGLHHTAKKPADFRKALDTLSSAEKLFLEEAKREPKPLEPRWGLSSCRTFIGLTYIELGQKQQAAAYFRKSLADHPNDHVAQKNLNTISSP
jgi:tetratricopeptide (TPR) repeat protein